MRRDAAEAEAHAIAGREGLEFSSLERVRLGRRWAWVAHFRDSKGEVVVPARGSHVAIVLDEDGKERWWARFLLRWQRQ